MKKHNIYFLAIICSITSMATAFEVDKNMVNMALNATQNLPSQDSPLMKNAEEIVQAIKELPEDIKKELPEIMYQFTLTRKNKHTGIENIVQQIVVDYLLLPSAYIDEIPYEGNLVFLTDLLLTTIEKLGREGKLQAVLEQMKRIKDLLLKQQRLFKEYKENSETCGIM